MRKNAYLVMIALVAVAGCNRQDTACLASIGRKLLDRAVIVSTEIGGKLDVPWKGTKADATAKADTTVKAADTTVLERIGQRLRWEKTLAGTKIRAEENEGEVTLRGTVATDVQKQRAVEVVEATFGVDKVTDELQVVEP
jgi:osmotically-inducible protein OsmY